MAGGSQSRPGAQVTPTTAPEEVPIEAIVLRQADAAGPQPTILSPHGGPHSCACTVLTDHHRFKTFGICDLLLLLVFCMPTLFNMNSFC